MYWVNVYLFGKPAWEMRIEQEDKIDTFELKETGERIRDWLFDVATIIDKLQEKGFTAECGLYDINLYPPEEFQYDSLDEFKVALDDLGIDMDKISVYRDSE